MRVRRLRSYAVPQLARVFVAEADEFALDAARGVFAVAGQDAGLRRTRLMGADAGALTIAGQAAALFKGVSMQALAGAYTLAGQDVAFMAPKRVTGDPGAFTVAGQVASLVRSLRVAGDAGSFSLVGQDAALRRGIAMAGDAGAYTVVGQDAGLVVGRKVNADAGAFLVAGQDATLTKSGGDILLEWGGSQGQTSAGANPMSFTSVGTGSPSSGRYLIISASARGVSGANRTITGLTVDGVAATLLVSSGSSSNPTAIFGIAVASGTTSNLSLSADGTMSRASVGIAAITNYTSTIPTDTDFTSATSTSIALPATISAGGIGVWCVSIASVNDITWSNATERYDVTPGSVFRGSAATYEDAAGSTRTATASWSGSSFSTMCAVSLR